MTNGIKEHSGGSLKLFFIILVTIVVNFHKSRITVQWPLVVTVFRRAELRLWQKAHSYLCFFVVCHLPVEYRMWLFFPCTTNVLFSSGNSTKVQERNSSLKLCCWIPSTHFLSLQNVCVLDSNISFFFSLQQELSFIFCQIISEDLCKLGISHLP